MPETTLSSYLARWEAAFADGRDVPAEELCPADSALAADLRQAIDALRVLKHLSRARTPVEADPFATDNPAGDGVPPGVPVGDPLCPPGYRLVRRLARGGQGVVYLAWQERLSREVALKVLDRDDVPEAQARFLADAEAIAAVRHPGIVQVHDYGTHAGVPYFALEYCAGGSLAGRLAGTPLPAREAAAVVEQVARAVQAAHDAGIVHRDLKPHNVLLCSPVSPRPEETRVPEGRGYIAKVTDFGLAKRVEGGCGLTATGAVLGTPSYMAPEQASDKVGPVGRLADVYGLGAVLYECLTGRPPFRAADVMQTLLQVVADDPVPPRQLNPAVPADLETVCLKCLQKDPARRYASAEELANDLHRFLEGEPIRARPVGAAERAAKWARRRPALAALVGVVLLALVALAGLFAVARQEAAKASKARDFLASIFDLSELEQKEGTFSPFQLLDRAEQRLPKEFADHPELRADLLATVTEARIGLGTPAAMVLEVRGAVELRPRKGGTQPATPNALLFPADRLNLGADAQVRLVVLADLHQEWLAPGREATVQRQGCEPAGAVARRADDILMPFVPLTKGTTYLGWDGTPGSAKKTEIPEDFEIAAHAVTQGQWQAVMGANPSAFSRRGSSQGSVSGISGEELKLFPVETVSWNDAQEFLKKLNDRERGSGYLYRLPREAEWEYACRGGATSPEECSYRFYLDKPSNDLSSDQANSDGRKPSGKGKPGKYLGRTTRVGSYPTNKLGLCEMHGNVWQWTDSTWEKDGSYRVLRGGSWGNSADDCAAAFWNRLAPATAYESLGLRLARVPVQNQGK